VWWGCGVTDLKGCHWRQVTTELVKVSDNLGTPRNFRCGEACVQKVVTRPSRLVAPLPLMRREKMCMSRNSLVVNGVCSRQSSSQSSQQSQSGRLPRRLLLDRRLLRRQRRRRIEQDTAYQLQPSFAFPSPPPPITHSKMIMDLLLLLVVAFPHPVHFMVVCSFWLSGTQRSGSGVDSIYFLTSTFPIHPRVICSTSSHTKRQSCFSYYFFKRRARKRKREVCRSMKLVAAVGSLLATAACGIRVGVGISDVTGPAAEVNMFGYGLSEASLPHPLPHCHPPLRCILSPSQPPSSTTSFRRIISSSHTYFHLYFIPSPSLRFVPSRLHVTPPLSPLLYFGP
jgi:hypothetical protein